MKQNSEFKLQSKSSEILDIYTILLIKYKDDFSSQFAYEIAEILYLNGIKAYMFFVVELDIDEIVDYIVKKKKVVKFCRKEESDLTNYDNEIVNNKNGRVIFLGDYFQSKYRRIVRK